MVYIFFKGKCKVPAVTHDKLLLMARKQIWSATKLQHKEGILGHPHKIRNANSDEIKYCGFGLCPNRFSYITRPDKLHEIFSIQFDDSPTQPLKDSTGMIPTWNEESRQIMMKKVKRELEEKVGQGLG